MRKGTEHGLAAGVSADGFGGEVDRRAFLIGGSTAALAALAGCQTVQSVAKDLVKGPLPNTREWQMVHRRLKGEWPKLVLLLARDYSRIRQARRTAPISMMQLLLLTRCACSSREAEFLPPTANLGSEVDLEDVADELVSVGSTPKERLSGYLYKLHEGDPETRVLAALILGQTPELATDALQHLLEELLDEDLRLVQEAITALGIIGPAAKDAIPTLEKFAEHEDPQIAERAKAALRQMRGR